MQGAELETYKGNKIVMGLVAVIALGAATLVYASFITDPPETSLKVIALSTLAVPVYFLVWLNSIQVTLHSDGISYRSLLGEKEMRWDSVERFGYESIKRSVNFIPVGTYYLFRLRDAEGNKIRIGNRVANPGKLGVKLIELTNPFLLRKAVERYNTGVELDFGAIKVSRTTGIKIKKFIGYKELPWDQVSSFAIQKGEFYIWKVGEKRTLGWGLHHVWNAFALLDLLHSIARPNGGREGFREMAEGRVGAGGQSTIENRQLQLDK